MTETKLTEKRVRPLIHASTGTPTRRRMPCPPSFLFYLGDIFPMNLLFRGKAHCILNVYVSVNFLLMLSSLHVVKSVCVHTSQFFFSGIISYSDSLCQQSPHVVYFHRNTMPIKWVYHNLISNLHQLEYLYHL